MSEQRYRCPDEECGHVCTGAEMGADSTDGEAWSNWICPKCKQWWHLEDWVPVNE